MFGRNKTPDELLVQEIRQKTRELRELGDEAKRRNITVWLEYKSWGKREILKPHDLLFNEAYRTDREQFS